LKDDSCPDSVCWWDRALSPGDEKTGRAPPPNPLTSCQWVCPSTLPLQPTHPSLGVATRRRRVGSWECKGSVPSAIATARLCSVLLVWISGSLARDRRIQRSVSGPCHTTEHVGLLKVGGFPAIPFISPISRFLLLFVTFSSLCLPFVSECFLFCRVICPPPVFPFCIKIPHGVGAFLLSPFFRFVVGGGWGGGGGARVGNWGGFGAA